MTYTTSFSLSDPTGLEPANTLDEIIRNVKIALNERFVDILGVDLSGATDPQRVTKIVIPAAGMNVRDSSDASSMIAVTNSNVTLRNVVFSGSAVTLPSGSVLTSPTLSGTMSGGTVAPSVLTVPNGTAIINASLTTPALVNPVIAGGVASDLTGLTVTGTPVITGNLTVTGNVTAGSLSGPTTVTAANVTAGTFQNAAYTFPNNLNVSGTLAPTTLTVPSATTLPSPTLTGTMTGGTVAPTTLTVPSGTTLPTPTITGTVTATGATVNNITLNDTTFTGTITGISTNPTVTALNLASNVNLSYSIFTDLLSPVVSAGSYMVFGQVYGTAQTTSTLNPCGIILEIATSTRVFRAFNSVPGAASVSYTGTTSVFGTFTLASSGNIILRALAQGNAGTPNAIGTLGPTEYSGLFIMRIA